VIKNYGQAGSGKNKRREKEGRKIGQRKGGREGKASGCINTKCTTIELVESSENVDDHVESELKYYLINCVATLETTITKLTINLREVAQRLIVKHAKASFNAT